MLKNSALNWSRFPSRTLKFLWSERFASFVPGPKSRLHPELPNCRNAGATNASVSNHLWIVCWLSGRFPSAIRSGLVPSPMFSVFGPDGENR